MLLLFKVNILCSLEQEQQQQKSYLSLYSTYSGNVHSMTPDALVFSAY